MGTGKRYDPWRLTAVCILVLSVAARQFSHLEADPDLWGHLEFGRANWEMGAIQRTDPYSFSAPEASWINHEWAAELAFFEAYRRAGDMGLLVLRLGLGLFTVLCLYVTCRIREPAPAALLAALTLAVFVMSRGYNIRPQIFSFLLFSVQLLLLHLFLIRGKRCLWLLPPLMALWCNLHGGFVLGLAILVGVTGWAWMSRLWGGEEQRAFRSLALCSLLSVGAVLFNPYGPGLLEFLYQTLSASRDITEWAPISLLDTSFLDFKLLATLAFLTVLWDRAGCRGWEAVVVGALFFATIRHQRNVVFFGLGAAPILAGGLSRLQEKLVDERRGVLARPLVTILVVSLLLAGSATEVLHVRAAYASVGSRILVDPSKYPVHAIRFIASQELQGNLFVSFDWGEYAIWKLYPDCRVSIDGRFRTVYPETVIRDHFFELRTTDGLADLLDKYEADILLWPNAPASQKAERSSETWTLAYQDPVAVVLVRRNSPNHARIPGGATVSDDPARLQRRYYFPG